MPSYVAAKAAHPSEDAVYFPRPSIAGTAAEPTTVTVGGLYNIVTPEGDAQQFRAPIDRNYTTVQSIDGNNVHVGVLHGYSSQADGWLNGCSLTAYRIVANEWTEVASYSSVANVVSRGIENCLGTNGSLPAGTTSAEWSCKLNYRPNATVYFRVMALKYYGQIGDVHQADYSGWSNMVSAVTPANTTGPSTSNPTEVQANITNGGVELPPGELAAPTNVQVSHDGASLFTITWDEVAGADAYQVWWSQYPTFAEENYFEIPGHAIQEGDLIVYTKEFDHTTTRAGYSHDRLWENPPNHFGLYRLLNYNDDPQLSFEYRTDEALPYIRITYTGSVARPILSIVGHGGSDQSWYQVLTPGTDYRSSLMMRHVSGSASVSQTVESTNTPDSDHTVTGAWAEYSHVFRRNTLLTGTGSENARVLVNGACVIDVRDWRVGEDGSPLGEFTTDIATKYAQAGSPMGRTHDLVKTRKAPYDIHHLTDDRLLGRRIRAMAGVTTKLWLQIEWHLSAAEWQGLAEYLAAPYVPGTDTPASKPFAYKRFSQGRAAPWTDAFTELWFEFGNENWQAFSQADFWPLPALNGRTRGATNALNTDFCARQIEASPHWTTAIRNKTKYVLGGQGADLVGSFSEDCINWTEKGDYITIPDYIGGWDNRQAIPDDPLIDGHWAQYLGSHVKRDRQARAEAFKVVCDARSAARGKPIHFGTYEAQAGYVLDGLNGGTVNTADNEDVDQSQLKKSVAGGTTVFNQWLENAAFGMATQNFFAFGNGKGGLYWASHSIETEGATFNAPFLWSVIFWNQHLAGGTIRPVDVMVEPQINVPIYDADMVQQGTQSGRGMRAFRIDRAGKVYLAFLNLSTTETYQVRTGTPPFSACTRHYMTGADFKDHNTTLAKKDDVALASETVTPTLPMVISLAPGRSEVYEFS